MKTNRKIFGIRAESLIETIVAVTVIAIGATAAGVMVRTSLAGVEISQDRMLALNLAREGIEAVRNIRDTNWLRYSSNADACWNTLHGTDITDCEDNLIAEDYYAIILDVATLEYYLLDVGYTDVMSNSEYLVYQCEITGPSGTGSLYATPSDATGCTESTFQRMVEITYENSDLMSVTSTVGWIDSSGTAKQVSLTEKIGNW